jgi:hypothetical protein
MKTAASYTKSELGKLLVDLAIDKFHNWADLEFNTLRHTSTFPVCVPLSSKSWIVANFQLDQLGQHNWRISKDNETVHIFYSKQAAVFYAIYTASKLYRTADRIMDLDKQVAKLSDDLHFYSTRLAGKSKDGFKLQLWESRYLETKSRYQVAKQELETQLLSVKAKFAKNLLTDK